MVLQHILEAHRAFADYLDRTGRSASVPSLDDFVEQFAATVQDNGDVTLDGGKVVISPDGVIYFCAENGVAVTSFRLERATLIGWPESEASATGSPSRSTDPR
jgi:hypothetical protein